jgi:hypothetical protein
MALESMLEIIPSDSTPLLLLGGYPKNSDDSPNTKEKVLNTFRHKVRALRGSDSLSQLHKSQKSESVYMCPRAPFYREMKGLLHS